MLFAALPLTAIAATAAELAVDPADDATVDKIAGAVLLDHPFPDVPNKLPVLRAYRIQASVVDGIYGTLVAGYQAGLTSAAAQRAAESGEPVLGILPQPNRLAPGAALKRIPGLKIQIEIGFLVGPDEMPAAMVPVVELPRQSYADMGSVRLADIVGSNLAAYRFITGATSLPDPNARDLPVSLERDGRAVFEGHGADAFGDPYRSYEWMVKQIHTLGYRLEPGMLLTTGELGGSADAQPGRYVAHFGALGDIKFTIEDNPHAIQTARQ